MIDYSAYLKVCRDAVIDEEIFNTFKRHPDYVPILEHVTYEQGLVYIDEITREFPYLLQHFERFATNDILGKPHLRYYPGIALDISPTILRYIKVLADLMNLFGRLDDLNIVEIGGGYGGQCKIIHDICIPKSYTIIDLPEASLLCKKYLNAQKSIRTGIDNVIFREVNNMQEVRYDLCISNYAYSEMNRKYQDLYTEKIIRFSDRGYMTCNFIVPENRSKEEIFALKPNPVIYEEKPLTAGDNIIYTWK